MLVIVVVLAFLPATELHLTEAMINGDEPINQLTLLDHFIIMTDPAIAFLEVVMILALSRRQKEWSQARDVGDLGVE